MDQKSSVKVDPSVGTQGNEFTLEGCNYGDISLSGEEIAFTSVVSKKPILRVKMDEIALCVVPANNRDDLEVQFVEHDDASAKEDCLVQMTFHFPKDEDKEGESTAETFHKSIMDTGLLNSLTGNIIAEFTKDQGNFVTPRGKYSIQMTSSYLHMQGAQYAYKIKYSDINSHFLLPKTDGGRLAFVIALDKPIRQGNQKYHNLVLETHNVEHTMIINLSEEEITNSYAGLSQEMTLPMSSLFAKIFKILSQKKVIVPKQFITPRETHCVRCSVKANEGLLYPLAKAFIFINKPCIIIKYEEIDYVEFKRYEINAHSATRNFDLHVILKDSAVAAMDGMSGTKEYGFMSIDRSEYTTLFDYISSKDLTIVNEGASANQPAGTVAKSRLQEMLEIDGEDSAGDSDEDDDDYEGGGSEHSRDSDDSGSDDASNNGDGEERAGGKQKKRKDKGIKAAPKKKRAKKDKNAPKGASGSYMFFSKEERPKVLAENPGLGFTDVGKEIGSRWKSISASEKERFDAMAREDKSRYEREMAEYRKSGGGADEADD